MKIRLARIGDKKNTRDELLDILEDYLRMIDRNGLEYPSVVLTDIRVSIRAILKKNRRDDSQ